MSNSEQTTKAKQTAEKPKLTPEQREAQRKQALDDAAKYVSELLGKATIDTNTYGKSDGMRGNFSTNYQNTGRELMTPDEVRLLDNRYAILFIRGERPVLDFKYDILKHPNLALTADGDRANAYEHGVRKPEGVRVEVVDISAYPGKTVKDFPEIDAYIADMEAFDDADLECWQINARRCSALSSAFTQVSESESFLPWNGLI